MILRFLFMQITENPGRIIPLFPVGKAEWTDCFASGACGNKHFPPILRGYTTFVRIPADDEKNAFSRSVSQRGAAKIQMSGPDRIK